MSSSTTTNNCNAEQILLQAAYVLLGFATFTLMSILTAATMLSSTPIEELGLRAKGTGLWSWMGSYLFHGPVGISGYDCIQGALSPPLRWQCHVTSILFLWAAMAILVLSSSSSSSSNNNACIMWNDLPMEVWKSGIGALTLYLGVCWVFHYVMDGVSMPGGARAHKMQRQPCWEDQVTTLPTTQKQWKCMVAEESHDYTEEKYAKTLSGEAAGRQIWSTTTTTIDDDDDDNKTHPLVSHLLRQVHGGGKNKTKNEEEDLIQTMAMGGRSYFGFNPSKNPNSCDMIFRAQQIRNYLQRKGGNPQALPSLDDAPQTVKEAAHKAAHFYSMLQCDDGHWAADYGGPHFLMPGMVTAWYIMGKPTNFLDNDQVELLKHYIFVHQQTDGGWGTHIESPSTMFGSTLMYVALRLLGVDKDHPAAQKGRHFVKTNGGALYTSSWSKFYLCLLGCMDWKGHNSVPPEMWMLPNWFPLHPGRMWCHARMVYLPMGYLYGHRFVYNKAETDPTIQSLRQELYCESNYDSIPWMKTRQWVAPMDNYSPIPWVMKILQNGLARYENWAIFQPFKTYVRAKGLAFSMEYIQAEDLQTNYIDIGPVNKVLNMISHFHGTYTTHTYIHTYIIISICVFGYIHKTERETDPCLFFVFVFFNAKLPFLASVCLYSLPHICLYSLLPHNSLYALFMFQPLEVT